jgi:Fe2+ or Zn2+ uptake regulation protein
VPELDDDRETLKKAGIQPSSQRLAVAAYVLHTEEHPSADHVWQRVKDALPMVSRATVYNTLNLFVEKGLLRQFVLKEGHVVFDPKVERHHHFIEEETGRIIDVPWNAVRVSAADVPGFEVSEYQVIFRGKRKRK